MKVVSRMGYFVRDLETNRVYCPQGEILRQKSVRKDGGIRYYKKERCKACPARKAGYCTSSAWKEIDFPDKKTIAKCNKWPEVEYRDTPAENENSESEDTEQKSAIAGQNEDTGQKSADVEQNEDTGQKSADVGQNEDTGQKSADVGQNEDTGQKSSNTGQNEDTGQSKENGAVESNVQSGELPFKPPSVERKLVKTEWRVRMLLTPDRQMMGKRMTLSEHPFGTMKTTLERDDFDLRGIKKVDGEFSFTALAYNMKVGVNKYGYNQICDWIIDAYKHDRRFRAFSEEEVRKIREYYTIE